MENKTKKFAIIGTGFIMPRHAEAINFIGGEIVDIISDAHGQNKWQEIIKNTKADYISVLTPNNLHFKMCKFAIDQSKTVLCEKPLAIKSRDIKKLINKKIFTVLQLRQHPLVKEIKSQIKNKKNNKIKIDISVYRDKKYYASWKGQEKRSGGVLFNLGIHYFDLLLYLFGQTQEVQIKSMNSKTGIGIIRGRNYTCNWRISTDEKQDNQRRVFKINNKNYNFSSQDNLSYENLHRFVYQDLIKNKGITPEQALKSVELVEKLYDSV